MGATSSFIRLSVWANSLTFCLEEEKMIVLDSEGQENISRTIPSFWPS